MKTSAVLIFIVTGVLCLGFGASECPCHDRKNCQPPKEDRGHLHNEVYVFSNGTTDVHLWRWESITALIAPSTFDVSNHDQAMTMCKAHSEGGKFGITVDMTLSGELNHTSEEAKVWINNTVRTVEKWYAEILTVNLMPYFKWDVSSTEEHHTELALILDSVKKNLDEEIDKQIQIACIVPWKPPCSELSPSCIFSSFSTEVCHYYIINPDSFTDLDNVKCRARATIPFSKLLYGISEYNSYHVPNNRIILGVAWHGYDYTCKSYVGDICELEQINLPNSNDTKCSFDQRVVTSNADILSEHAEAYQRHETNILYNAPFFKYEDDSGQHQVWFEDHLSLHAKYRLASELKVKGLAIMYGDDLSVSINPKVLMNDGVMWSWVAHEYILTSSKKTVMNPLHNADVFAGVSVSCLLVGVILGVVFTCVALRKRVKKPKQPFLRDVDTGIDDFTDEDGTL